MLEINVNESTVKELLQKAIDERVEELAKEKFFMTFKELEKYVNLSRPTIEDRLLKNGMRFFKQGSKYLFRKSDVDQFLNEMCESMTATNNDIKFFTGLKRGEGI